MAKRIKDLAAVVGTYQSNGDEKRRYMNVGCIMENDDGGMFIMLNRFVNYAILPRKQGSDSILISAFDVKEREQSAEQKPSSYVEGLDDDIPF